MFKVKDSNCTSLYKNRVACGLILYSRVRKPLFILLYFHLDILVGLDCFFPGLTLPYVSWVNFSTEVNSSKAKRQLTRTSAR